MSSPHRRNLRPFNPFPTPHARRLRTGENNAWIAIPENTQADLDFMAL